MFAKRLSIELCDIKRCLTGKKVLTQMLPINSCVRRKNMLCNGVPEDVLIGLKRKRDLVKEESPDEENEEVESNTEAMSARPQRKIVKILSDSEKKLHNQRARRNTKTVSYFEKESTSEDSDEEKIIPRWRTKKVISKEENSSEDSDIETRKTASKSDYEKMVEKNRAERLAFLESLKIDELKSDFADVVKKKRKPIQKSINEKKAPPPFLPIRKSRRLANLNVDFSEEGLFKKAVQDELQSEKIISIPAELDFSEALGSEECYESYIKDVNIQETDVEKKYFLYDKSSLQSMTLISSNIAKVIPERVTALAWYPSSDNLILSAGGKRGHMGIWNVDSESNPHLFKIHNEGITNLQFNPFNPAKLLTSSYEGTLRCGDMIKHKFNEVYNVSDETSCTYFDFVSPTTYLVALKNGHVALVDQRSSKSSEKKHCCHFNSVKTVNLHPVSNHIFVTAENRGASVRLWDLRKLQNDPIVDIQHHKKCVNSAFFSPVTGNSLLTTSLDDTLCIFDSTNLIGDLKLKSSVKHNNQTGRWLSIFRATWLPKSDELFAIGDLPDYPRRVQIYDKNLRVYHLLMHENMTTITSLNVFHPFRSAFAGSNSSGKVFVYV